MAGLLVIDLDTYQVLRFKASTDMRSTSNNPLFRFRDGRITYDFVFRAAPGGAVPEHLSTSYTVTMSRLLKPVISLTANGFTYFYDWQPAAPAGVSFTSASVKESDLDAIKTATYDPAFWRDNPVVKRTPLEEEVIRSFEQEKAFGTLLDK